MKLKFIPIMGVMFMLFLTYSPVNAGELGLEFTQWSRNANEDTVTVGPYRGAKLTYTFDNGLYLFVSHDKAKIMFLIDGFTYDFTGIGPGFRTNLTKNISIFGDIGYYFIGNDWGNREQCGDNNFGCNEGLYYYQTRRFQHNRARFSGHIVEAQDTWGGTFGISFKHDITKKLNVGMSLSYRVLVFNEIIKSRLSNLHPTNLSESSNPYYYKQGHQDMSGVGISFFVKRKF